MFRDLPAIWQATPADPALQKLDAEDRATPAGLQITLIGAVLREALTLPPAEAQRLLAQLKRGSRAVSALMDRL